MAVIVRRYADADRERVVQVWRTAGLLRPVWDPYRDIDRKLACDPGGLLVADREGVVVGAVMAGYDGHRGWINYLGVDPAHQREGVGRALVDAAVEYLRDLGCPKVNLQVRRTNSGVVRFYEALGFGEDDVLSMGKRLVGDETFECGQT
jgi:ribosomal protein S18 acetylase RimI-like enzyme